MGKNFLDSYTVEDCLNLLDIFYDEGEISRLKRVEPKRYRRLNRELKDIIVNSNINFGDPSRFNLEEFSNSNKSFDNINIKTLIDINDATSVLSTYSEEDLKLAQNTCGKLVVKYTSLFNSLPDDVERDLRGDLIKLSMEVSPPTLQNTLKVNQRLNKIFSDERYRPFIEGLEKEDRSTLKSIRYTTENISKIYSIFEKYCPDAYKFKNRSIEEFYKICGDINNRTDPIVNKFVETQNKTYKHLFKYNILNLNNIYESLDKYIDYFEKSIPDNLKSNNRISLKDRKKFKETFKKYDKEINELLKEYSSKSPEVEKIRQKYKQFEHKLEQLSVMGIRNFSGNDPVLKFMLDCLAAVLEIGLLATKQAILVAGDVVISKKKAMVEYKKIERELRETIRNKNKLVKAFNKEIDRFTKKLSKDEKSIIEKSLYLEKQFKKIKDKDQNLKIMTDLLEKFAYLSHHYPQLGAHNYYDKLIDKLQTINSPAIKKVFNRNNELDPEVKIELKELDFKSVEQLRQIADSEEFKEFINYTNYVLVNPDKSSRELYQQLKKPLQATEGYRVKPLLQKEDFHPIFK